MDTEWSAASVGGEEVSSTWNPWARRTVPGEKSPEWSTRASRDLTLTAMRLVGSAYVVGPTDGLPFGNSYLALRPLPMPQTLKRSIWPDKGAQMVVSKDQGDPGGK